MMDGGASITGHFGMIASGLAGVKATLRIMVMVARGCLKPTDPTKTNDLLMLRTTAQTLVQNCGEKDYWCEASQLQAFVRDKIRYVRDIRDVETIQFPVQTLQLQSGDCDDKSVLLAVLAECIGFETRFCAIGVRGESYSHVSTQILIPGRGWTNAETIPIDNQGSKAALGWFPPDATCLMLAHV